MEASEESGGSIEGINRSIVGCKFERHSFFVGAISELIDT